MHMEIVESKVRQFIIDNFLFGEGADGLKDEESLLEKGLIDSTGILELVSYLQRSFHIKVDDNEIVPENLDSIHSIAGYVRRKSASDLEGKRSDVSIPQDGRKPS